MPACHECRFWDAKAGPNLGYCRRRSPSRRPKDYGAWPVTRPVDWCGEFAAIAPAQDEGREEYASSRPADWAQPHPFAGDQSNCITCGLAAHNPIHHGPPTIAPAQEASGPRRPHPFKNDNRAILSVRDICRDCGLEFGDPIHEGRFHSIRSSGARHDGIAVMAKLAPGEPVFVLRGQDVSAPDAVRHWADMTAGIPDSKYRDALACALEMEQWTGPKKQPD